MFTTLIYFMTVCDKIIDKRPERLRQSLILYTFANFIRLFTLELHLHLPGQACVALRISVSLGISYSD